MGSSRAVRHYQTIFRNHPSTKQIQAAHIAQTEALLELSGDMTGGYLIPIPSAQAHPSSIAFSQTGAAMPMCSPVLSLGFLGVLGFLLTM